MTVVDLTLHKSNSAAHAGMRALIEFRDAENALREAKRMNGGRAPKKVAVRLAEASSRLQKAVKEYERVTTHSGADHGG